MKLAKAETYAIPNDPGVQVQEFGISNESLGVILDILRSKMYSNPIQTICREILSNCRDAHREVGNEAQPCEVIFLREETLDSECIVFRDYGPGISPERFRTIYLNYGASTKRNDNTQTGGFGLGAKTPFSYADSFLVKTVVDGTHYTYVAAIDETQKGKMFLLNSVETDLPNQTEVVVPLKDSRDRQEFLRGVLLSTYLWKVQPVIKGVDIKAKDWSKEIYYEDEDLLILRGNGNSDLQQESIAVDDILYPVNPNAITFYHSNRSTDFRYIVKCKTGEVSLSATREQLHYTDATLKVLKQKIAQGKAAFIQFVKTRAQEFQDRNQKIGAYLFLKDIYTLLERYYDQNTQRKYGISFNLPLILPYNVELRRSSDNKVWTGRDVHVEDLVSRKVYYVTSPNFSVKAAMSAAERLSGTFVLLSPRYSFSKGVPAPYVFPDHDFTGVSSQIGLPAAENRKANVEAFKSYINLLNASGVTTRCIDGEVKAYQKTTTLTGIRSTNPVVSSFYFFVQRQSRFQKQRIDIRKDGSYESPFSLDFIEKKKEKCFVWFSQAITKEDNFRTFLDIDSLSSELQWDGCNLIKRSDSKVILINNKYKDVFQSTFPEVEVLKEGLLPLVEEQQGLLLAHLREKFFSIPHVQAVIQLKGRQELKSLFDSPVIGDLMSEWHRPRSCYFISDMKIFEKSTPALLEQYEAFQKILTYLNSHAQILKNLSNLNDVRYKMGNGFLQHYLDLLIATGML